MRVFALGTILPFVLITAVAAAEVGLVVPQLAKPVATPVEGDPLQAKYDAAWARYEQSIAAVTAGVNKSLDGFFNRAADSGNLDLADMWDRKKKSFADTKTLEWPSDGKAKTEWRKKFAEIDFPDDFTEVVKNAEAGYAAAVKTLKDDYESLVREYTQERNLGRAKQLRDEVASLEPKPASPPQIPKPVDPPPMPKPPRLAPKPWPQDKKGAVQFRGHWYKVFPEKLTWHQAKARCAQMEGHLVVVNDAQEEAFIRALAANAGIGTVWLGGSDEAQEGLWVWVDGTPLTYFNWGPSQPNNMDNEEHYLALKIHAARWWDLKSIAPPEYAIGFICEWDE